MPYNFDGEKMTSWSGVLCVSRVSTRLETRHIFGSSKPIMILQQIMRFTLSQDSERKIISRMKNATHTSCTEMCSPAQLCISKPAPGFVFDCLSCIQNYSNEDRTKCYASCTCQSLEKITLHNGNISMLVLTSEHRGGPSRRISTIPTIPFPSGLSRRLREN